jgi:RNA recognition motif-containing protein
MHWWTTDAALEGLVRTYGPVTNCRFLEERATGKSKGAAVVEFADAEAAKRCKAELHG